MSGIGWPNTRQHSLRLDQATATTLYIGEASFGSLDGNAVWRIRRFVTVGAESTMLYADGDDLYDNVWTNRAALSYS